MRGEPRAPPCALDCIAWLAIAGVPQVVVGKRRRGHPPPHTVVPASLVALPDGPHVPLQPWEGPPWKGEESAHQPALMGRQVSTLVRLDRKSVV